MGQDVPITSINTLQSPLSRSVQFVTMPGIQGEQGLIKMSEIIHDTEIVRQ